MTKKAKDYVDMFLGLPRGNEKEVDKALHTVVVKFMSEGSEIAKSRNPKDPAFCLIGALNEQSDKWRAFANQINNRIGTDVIKINGFRDFVYHHMPELKGRLK